LGRYQLADLRVFRQFIAVAEEMSFRRAAARLHMAQPPLTATIKQLEQELGAVLIERSNRVVALTAAGQVFLQEARRTLSQAERTLRLTRRAAQGLTGSLRVGFVGSSAWSILPSLVVSFRQAHPEVDLELQEATTTRQLLALQNDEMDVGIVALPLAPRMASKLTLRLIHEGELGVVVAAASPLAQQPGPVALAELAEQPWIMFPEEEGPGLHQVICAACAQAGYQPRLAQTAVQMTTIMGLVAAQLGVALVPDFVARASGLAVAYRRLMGPGTPVAYRLALVHAAGHASAVVQAFCSSAIPSRDLQSSGAESST
jgi:DNA-binding transcriptional LysR family regulator